MICEQERDCVMSCNVMGNNSYGTVLWCPTLHPCSPPLVLCWASPSGPVPTHSATVAPVYPTLRSVVVVVPVWPVWHQAPCQCQPCIMLITSETQQLVLTVSHDNIIPHVCALSSLKDFKRKCTVTSDLSNQDTIY